MCVCACVRACHNNDISGHFVDRLPCIHVYTCLQDILLNTLPGIIVVVVVVVATAVVVMVVGAVVVVLVVTVVVVVVETASTKQQ